MIILGGDSEAWGFIPGFLDEADPRGARQQFDERYPGGWVPAPRGLKFDFETGNLSYPGDPDMRAISTMIFRHEMLLLFPSSWVVIVQPLDRSWEAARMD